MENVSKEKFSSLYVRNSSERGKEQNNPNFTCFTPFQQILYNLQFEHLELKANTSFDSRDLFQRNQKLPFKN